MVKESGNFKFTPTKIDGVVLIDVKKFGDNRGYFMETYKKDDFVSAGLCYDFVQDNQSKSKRGVLRGLHFQKQHQQAKLVRCIDGEVFDVCVDLRKGSSTYGQWVGAILSSKRGNQILIPKGFAHGFVVLSETAVFAYKCDELYCPNDEGGIIYNDPSIAIEWPNLNKYILSEKDKAHPLLKDIKIQL